MKIKLQTMLKHKLQWLMLLAALLGVSQGVWGNYSATVTVNRTSGSCDPYIWAWDPDNTSTNYTGGAWPGTAMTSKGGGVYETTLNVSSSTYKFIISNNGNNQSGDQGPFSTSIDCNYDCNGNVTINNRYVAGNGTVSNNWCCGADWSTSACLMSKSGTTYSKTFSNVPSGDYEFKITSGSWSGAVGYSTGTNTKSSGHITSTTIDTSVGDGNNITFRTTETLNITVYYDGTDAYIYTEVPCSTPSTQTINASSSSICSGSSVTISTAASESDVTYKLYIGSTLKSTKASTSTSGVTFDAVTLSSSGTTTFTVKALTTGTSCEETVVGTKDVTVNANPSKPTIKSYTASVCSGGAPTFTVASSTGLTYQMYTGGSTSGSSVAGEDSKDKTLTAAAITSATSYVMRATNGNGCYAESDAASVTITPDMALTSITLTPSNICVGGTSEVSLTGLNIGGAGVVTYTSGTPAVATIAAKDPATAGATASGVSVGTSIITATVSGGCGSAPDPKTATLNVKAAPTAYTLSASGESEAYICSAGGTLTLSGSQSGYSYQLKKDGSASGTAKTGTGSTLEFTVYESGEYTCEAYLTDSPDCKTDMTGTVILHISLTPVLLPATPTVKNYEPVTITSINTDIETWTISNAGNTAYLYNITSNSATVKASKANSPYTVTATTPGGCSSTVTVTVGDYTETCAP